MIFGKFDYINLLPLTVYLKKYPLPNGFKATLFYKKGEPSHFNKELFYRRVDGAMTSSIESVRKKYKNLDFGICANKQVLSVLVEKDSAKAKDPSSATSNALSQVLGLKGRVIIGDKALKLYIKDPNSYIDLCDLWYKKTHLPFVFARFSCVRKKVYFSKILKSFARQKIKIPQYILQKYVHKKDISAKDIKHYLNEIIYYNIAYKEKKALKRFVNAVKFKKEI
ncbi:MqnA/MqnD/SBP family protein [Campylobacter aviculae]|uniref:Chorismate dehydratase n=1 Tax=Campylobacter aviculae TaxID=2510190 RepID=A0A4U7BJV3_9BACT|nr:MqnA/MqnD/SBP family protein [Campylobacter aviculae]TKX32258.1 menaquinone via futalosine step 1 [Campylobacter aviculae]